MRAPKNLVLLALLLLFAAAVAGWVFQRAAARGLEARIERAEIRAASAEAKVAVQAAEKKELQRALVEMQERADKLEAIQKKNAELLARKEAKREANAAAKQLALAGEVAGANPPPAGPLDTWVASAGDPAVVRRLNEAARLQTTRRYGALLDQLGLAPDQREQLTKLLTDKRQVPLDLAAATFQGGGDPREDPATYADLIAATRQDLETQIHALLGDAGYQSYQAFDRGVGQLQVIGRLGELLTAMQQPLSADQATQLQAVMQANNVGHISAKVVNDATAFLSPVQLQALRDLRAIQLANSRQRNAPVQVLPTAPGGN